MARVLNIEIPNNKKARISLTYIFGIGPTIAKQILADANVDGEKRVKELTEEELTRIRDEAKKYTTEGDLKREINLNIKRLMEIKSYRVIRHRKDTCKRSTKKNARTRKGPKKDNRWKER
uniref:Small ribosomal subunit protein uS13 n=1 Tax=Mycoplasma sp. TaxID=2108 RepID=RS13_MYCSP|nr:RecName: Full=Small ribosomal subunit protein uS13; AltName: Full=30S ribosomal protein S13 [Mycoplasma sp.]pir/C49923/ ribosomal protein S13 - Chlamydia trachomatis [Chlamydia trachomatis]AAA16205.1 S13 [Chlamydia muridarum]